MSILKAGSKYTKTIILFMLMFLLIMGFNIASNSIFAGNKTDLQNKTNLRQMEKIGRALVAIKQEQGVYVAWRMLGTDNKNIKFNLYRDHKKINSKAIETSTNFIDKSGTIDSKYSIEVLESGMKREMTREVNVWDKDYLSVPLNKPAGGVINSETYEYTACDSSVADLDGDGEYEIVLKWDPTNSKDNSKSGYTGNVIIDAYKLSGKQLWRIDMGINVRAGAHYTQMMVYDLDGDGKAEVALKTADGTKAGDGTVIGDSKIDNRNTSGTILTGSEFLTVFEGKSGKILDSINYEPARGDVAAWGDTYGNRSERNLATIAYLDGKRPSFVMARGYYTGKVNGVTRGQTKLFAYNFRNGKISNVWNTIASETVNTDYIEQGNHNISVADVDGDSCDEIIYGSCAFDNDGKPLYSTKLGHGDAMHVSDFIPSRPGLEVFKVNENKTSVYGMEMHDAKTGEVLYGAATEIDTGRGMAADVDPTYEGAECWSIGLNVDIWQVRQGYMFNAKGEKISDMGSIPSTNGAIWWDGDLLRELQDHNWNVTTNTGVPIIDKWDYKNKTLVNLKTFTGTYSNNWTKGNPCFQADLFGDWREEIALRSEDSTELRIYTTTIPTDKKIYTLMHDPVYRLGVAWENVAYNQPPHTGFFLGEGMSEPPKPGIYVR